MDIYFEGFLEIFGQPTATRMASAPEIEKFRGKLPDQLLAYWEKYGFCSFQDGLFCIVNPDDFAADVDTWIGSTPIVLEDTYHAIARTAFGELLLWGEKNGDRYNIDPIMHCVLEQDGSRSEITAGKADYAMQLFFASRSPKSYDEFDHKRKRLFQRAREKWGVLGPDEVFAFEPAIVAGGIKSIQNIAKRNIHVYLSILSQLAEIKVIDDDELANLAFGSRK